MSKTNACHFTSFQRIPNCIFALFLQCAIPFTCLSNQNVVLWIGQRLGQVFLYLWQCPCSGDMWPQCSFDLDTHIPRSSGHRHKNTHLTLSIIQKTSFQFSRHVHSLLLSVSDLEEGKVDLFLLSTLTTCLWMFQVSDINDSRLGRFKQWYKPNQFNSNGQ